MWAAKVEELVRSEGSVVGILVVCAGCSGCRKLERWLKWISLIASWRCAFRDSDKVYDEAMRSRFGRAAAFARSDYVVRGNNNNNRNGSLV